MDDVALSWAQVREQVSPLNPRLAAIIDAISPDVRFRCYRLRLPFGANILKQGRLALHHLSRHVLEDLGPNPLMLVLHNQFELFASLADRIIPYAVLKPGQLFGLWQLLDRQLSGAQSYLPYTIWDMTAGARSLFLLPKISDRLAHRKLTTAANCQIEKPKNYFDHGRVFHALHNSSLMPEPWTADILLFNRAWLEALDDQAFLELKLYFYELMWQQSELWRSQVFWDLSLSRMQSDLAIRQSPYHMDLARHCLAISAGVLPGFAPAVDDSFAPVSALQTIYREIYGLDHWSPVMMQAATYDLYGQSNPVYYSLQYPTAVRLAVKPTQRESVINDIFHLSILMNQYAKALKENQYQIDATSLSEIPKRVTFTYYHSMETEFRSVSLCTEMYKSDSRFIIDDPNQFPRSSRFFTGCVQIKSQSDGT